MVTGHIHILRIELEKFLFIFLFIFCITIIKYPPYGTLTLLSIIFAVLFLKWGLNNMPRAVLLRPFFQLWEIF